MVTLASPVRGDSFAHFFVSGRKGKSSRPTRKLPPVIEAYFEGIRQELTLPPLEWRHVKRAYTSRPYHNLGHLEEMLDTLRKYEDAATFIPPADPPVFGLALVYHDIVYKPTRLDNEERSADSAAQALASSGAIAASRIERCRQLILATREHVPSPVDDGDEGLLIDLDLAVLARDAAGYDRYRAAIRKEFWMIPGFVFRKKRSDVLTRLLDRKAIYFTPYGQEILEPRARKNLWRELRNL